MKSIHNNKQFNQLVKSGKPFVLDFYADWCGPCQSLLPTVEKVADEYEGQVEIRKVNIDKQKDLAAMFQVKSIPALFFMDANKIKDKVNGMISESAFRKKVASLV